MKQVTLCNEAHVEHVAHVNSLWGEIQGDLARCEKDQKATSILNLENATQTTALAQNVSALTLEVDAQRTLHWSRVTETNVAFEKLKEENVILKQQLNNLHQDKTSLDAQMANLKGQIMHVVHDIATLRKMIRPFDSSSA